MTKWRQVEVLSRLVLAGMLVLVLLVAMFPSTSAAQLQTMDVTCSSGYALWANGQSRDDRLVISGSTNRITGITHSNADLRISGSDNRITGAVEYVTLFEDGGDNNTYVAPTQVAVSTPPLGYAITDFQPGGIIAEAARSVGRYTVITGDFDVSEPGTLNGLYYVTGDVKLSASDLQGTVTIVAEGTIDVSGSSHRLRAFVNGLLLFSAKDDAGAEVIKLAGSNSRLRGVIYGPRGTVELSGSNSTITGIILGDALTVNGSNLAITFDRDYCPGTGTPIIPPSDDNDDDCDDDDDDRDDDDDCDDDDDDRDDDDDSPSEPPAIFIINETHITQRIEVINNITFVNIQINITNTGGDADNIFLVIDRNDDDDDWDDFELVEVLFAQGTGYVHSQSSGRIMIGIGLYNVVRRDHTVSVDIRFRLRDNANDDDNDGQIVFTGTSSLLFSDSDGTHTVALPALLVPVPVVPVVVVPVVPVPVNVVRLPLDRIDVRFRVTWEQRGGIAIFGLPITESRTRADGTIVQIFERARLEYRDGTIFLGRLAAELGYITVPTIRYDDLDDDDRRWYFVETGHVIGDPFRVFWAEQGGLLLFGLPIGSLTTDDDGRTMQCFERVCMQAFPEYSGTPYSIQLRLLGLEILDRDDDD